ncbi:hypothetical protein [Frigoriglobus tundricola]|uniref:Uncharacterized protein n=1 Tax=Frigoriglobus tundricola TaxID=2774151 RepID=A0A6M5Z1M2_9BACT|nr:hypothetical protein [Frigoriglobus tundricola]QJX00318.1 hypothetical protein FTUN_7944 [Frigoriglobus tundricola]
MDIRVNADEFAVMEWLHRKRERAAPDVKDFLASVLREQLKMEEVRYNRARDYLQHFKIIELRQAELESGTTVEAIQLTPDGENLYRHAVRDPDRYRFEPAPAAAR